MYYFSPSETSEILDIGYRTLLRWLEEGRFGKVLRTPTRRYRISWDNIKHFCTKNGYEVPDKIPRPRQTKKIEWVSVSSKEAKVLLNA